MCFHGFIVFVMPLCAFIVLNLATMAHKFAGDRKTLRVLFGVFVYFCIIRAAYI